MQLKKVVVDIGHLGNDSGAVGNGLKEADLNEKVARKVIDILVSHGIEVVESTGTLVNRVMIEKQVCPDLFISIHTNSFNNPNSKGFEVLVYKKGQLSEKCSENIVKEVMDAGAASVSRGVKERPDLYVLKNTRSQALLIEMAFISNKEDIKYIADDAGQARMARSIAKGILKTYEIKYNEVVEEKKTLYRVCIGSYESIENARKVTAEASQKGLDAFIHICKE